VIVGFRYALQHALADGQRRLGGGDRVEFLRRGPFVGSGVAVGRGLDEPAQVVVPALAVAGRLLVAQPLVHQPDERPARRGLQRDGDGRRPGRQVGGTLPAPGEDDALARLNLGDGAAG